MGVKQFNASYNKQEDRMVFRFNTHDDQEFLFWFTRFITKAIIDAVDQLIQKNLEQKHNPQIAEVIKDFQSDGVKKTTKMDESYAGATNYPFGKEPILVTALNFHLMGDVFSMDFKLIDQKNVNIKLPIASTQKMALLLRTLCERAQWGVSEQESDTVIPNVDSGTKAGPSGLMH